MIVTDLIEALAKQGIQVTEVQIKDLIGSTEDLTADDIRL